MELYQIVRGLDSPGPLQTLRTYAYNDAYASVADSGFKIRNVSVWSGLLHYHFVQKDGFFYISAHEYADVITFKIADTCAAIGTGCKYFDWDKDGVGGPCYFQYQGQGRWCGNHGYEGESPNVKETCKKYGTLTHTNPKAPDTVALPKPIHRMFADGEDVFTFPAATGSGNITSVAIHAFAQGKCKVSLKVGSGTKTYSGTSSEKFVFSWFTKTFSKNPDGSAWEWADLAAGNVQAGIYLYCNSGDNSGICRHFKLVVTTDEGEEVTVWPSGDVSTTCRLVVGNPLIGASWPSTWKDTGSVAYPMLEATTPAAGTVTDRYISSELSEVPPRFSVIGGITVSFSFRASTAVSGSYARPFLEVAGTKYYGTSRSIVGSTSTLHEYTQTWATNPATGAAWQYDDYVGLRFGLHYHAGGNATATALYLFELYQDTTYQERAEIASLHSISGCTLDSLTMYSQNPITPDDLIFYCTYPLPERLEVAYYKAGVPRFQGFVWTITEMPDGTYLTKAKSSQVGLQYRAIPRYYHRPRNETLDSAFTIDELFSDDAPTHPSFAHIGNSQNYTSSEVD